MFNKNNFYSNLLSDKIMREQFSYKRFVTIQIKYLYKFKNTMFI